jgi:hypothetical protein
VVLVNLVLLLELLPAFQPALTSKSYVVLVCNKKKAQCHDEDDHAGQEVRHPPITRKAIAEAGSTGSRGGWRENSLRWLLGIWLQIH